MKKERKPSISIIKIICVSLILLALSGAGVIVMATQVNTVTVTLASGYELTVLTNKTKVSDILEENNIVLEESERVTPNLEEEITSSNTITICDKSIQEIQVAKVSESGIETTIEEILDNYSPIIEKIVTQEEAIPFETITKDVSSGSGLTTNQIIQSGKNGEKKVTYKVTYKDDVEIEREEISSEIITEPVYKIVEVQTKTVTSRSSSRTTGTSGQSGIYKITAYCSCAICCGQSTGITASGATATANHTIAAPSTFSFGTKVVINGVTYTVEDRGGAIQGNCIDIYMDTHAEALQWGVRYLYVEVLN